MRAGTTRDLHAIIEDDRQQRATTLLRDVGYVIEAHFVLTAAAGEEDTEAKFAAMFDRRASAGQCFHRPYLGTREFAAHFASLDGDPPLSSLPENQRNRDLGWMVHDIDYAQDMSPALPSTPSCATGSWRCRIPTRRR